MMRIARNLLWIDCTAAALAGATVLALSKWLSGLYALPLGLLLFMGTVSLLYACYSFTLAALIAPRKSTITLLVAGNLAWALVCLGLVAAFSGTATMFGVGLLVAEAVFVSVLALFEWRYRDQLVAAV